MFGGVLKRTPILEEDEMLKKTKNFSSVSRGLKYKLRLAVALMSILPLLVLGYLVSNYLLPQAGFKLDITLSVLISIFIALIGFFVIKGVFDRILSIITDAKLIAAGDLQRKIDIERTDEVGDLGQVLNQLAQRIRQDMDELKNYSQRTTEINLEIQKRVLVLSSLLQINSLISEGARLEEILNLAIARVRLLDKSDTAYLLLKEGEENILSLKAIDGTKTTHLLKIKIILKNSIFDRVIKTNKPLVLDKENVLPQKLSSDFYETFKLKNTIAYPLYLKGKAIGILGIGNTKDDFIYQKDDLELLDIFTKQVAVAIENNALMQRIERLEIKDALTGLYNESFMQSRLQEEIKRAIVYQRPCAFILLNIDNFQAFRQNFGSLQAEVTLKKTAQLIKDSVTEIDRVGRIQDNEFAIVLPEKNKRQAQEIAEALRKKIEFSFSEEQDSQKRITLSGGVAENPLDGIEAKELIVKAREYLSLAKAGGKNRVC